jgi:NAD(P)-dependent dehydrogenase (short-subunit alcohol dehydrogenase family)
MTELKGSIAIVTGGGRGLGAEITRMLVAEGAVVAVADIDGDRAQAYVRKLESNGRCIAVRLDVRDEQSVHSCVAGLQERYGRLDIVVNNAAVDYTLPLSELSVGQWDAVIATNLRGPFLLAKCASVLMERQGGGHIVNIASTASRRAWPNAAAYHASKWGLLGLSYALHAEMRPKKIR